MSRISYSPAFLVSLTVVTATFGPAQSQFVIESTASLQSCRSAPVVYSCEATEAIANTCCITTPGGLILQTQFWSTWTGLEKKGQKLPKDSWTIHGLWPDNCNGSFEQYCDASRQFDPHPSPAKLPNGTVITPYKGPSVDTLIKAFGRNDLLHFMDNYWINQGGPNSDLWAHEFSKHGTCMSTFDLACFGSPYRKHEEIMNYYDSVIRAFHQYPTFDMLAAFGIVPSNKTAYNLADIQSALKTQTGATPYLGCSNNGTALSEVWYFNHVLGTPQYGHFKPVESTSASSCSTTSPIWYYERTATSEREVRGVFGNWPL
ncbi:ribonuclease T2 [Pluteus cervinus]|uniref:Ribonuclease T2 n=1 Tax=Pluteus cervinus TaxID=181527 RepID=A0ACD3BI13_9AGAR|nr:ribonuclease T2 [Pluteus cervinus]